MKTNKLLALLAALCVLCSAVSGTALTASAAEITLTDSYEAAVNQWVEGLDTWNFYRHENWLVRYDYGFDAAVDYAANASKHSTSWYVMNFYTEANRTATNAVGIEIAVNQYGFVSAIEDKVGNMAIPVNGYVLSANGTKATTIRNMVNSGIIRVGDYMYTDSNEVNYRVLRETDDDKNLNTSLNIAYSQLLKKDIIVGGEGVTTGSGEWNTDVLVKITGAGADTTRYQGYVVQVGGNNIAVPEGYFAICLAGQILKDDGTEPLNAAQLFFDYAPIGSIVNCGVNEIYFRYDDAAAVRAAHLLTGMTNDTVTDVYDYSANTMVNDAYDQFELVDIDAMQALYDNMQAITESVSTTMDKQAMATLYQNYAQLQRLEFEVRTVEMRASWMRPLPNDGKHRTQEELDALLTEKILEIKNQGYNMIFVEAFYNSTTVFPVPETVGYNELSFNQNPYLVPVSEGGLNTNLTETYDMLQRFIDICEENDMEPHIWWEVFYVGYQRTNGLTDSLFDYSVIKTIMANPDKYPNWLNKASNGDLYYGAQTDSAWQYFLNPASTGARTFLMNTFEYIWETYDVKSFQLDYIRYPHTTASKCFGYDEDTLAAFHAAYPNNTTDLYSYEGFYDEEWVQFRANYVTSFVEEIHAKMAEVAPQMYLTSSPGADPADSKKNLMQDVTYWLQNDLIDIIFPMAYGVNIPGNVSAGLVADNSEHFVCTGVSGSYLDNDLELRWMKEVREAGTDGLAAFTLIPDYVDYVWSEPAVSPIGNAARAARTYLADTVNARADMMLKHGAIDADKVAQIKAASAAADEAIRFYGIKSTQALSAINNLQTIADTLGVAKAAMTKDVNYLLKIRNNARDDLAQAADAKTSASTLAVNGNKVIDGGEGFSYVAATETLYVTADNAVLSGNMVEPITLVLADDVNKVEFNNVDFSSTDVVIETANDPVIDLTGTTNLGGEWTANATYIGTGELYCGGELVMRKGDVIDDGTFDTTDLRSMLLYNVKAESLTEEQILIGDADGNGKLNTIDTRIFLDKLVNEGLN